MATSKESREEARNRIAAQKAEIVWDVVKAYPRAKIDYRCGRPESPVIVHFVPRYDATSYRPIAVRVFELPIGNTMPNLEGLFFSREDAEAAIIARMAEANEKADRCREALTALQESLGFRVSHFASADDDQGLESGTTIEFTLSGFEFVFTLE